MSWFRWDGPALVLQLKLQPGASRSEFAGLHGEQLKVRIQAPALEGRANAALAAFLADRFAVAKSCIRIERGELGRSKTVRVSAPGILPEALLKLGLSPPHR